MIGGLFVILVIFGVLMHGYQRGLQGSKPKRSKKRKSSSEGDKWRVVKTGTKAETESEALRWMKKGRTAKAGKLGKGWVTVVKR